MPRPISFGRWKEHYEKKAKSREAEKRDEEMEEASIEVRLSRPDTRSSMDAGHHVAGAALSSAVRWELSHELLTNYRNNE